ncbi:efflux RND transporter periplasmic adaptor subunit [Ferrimonas marina]|uniref:RND family efflux transporter, MFP subunit n=1 Tax=Ferrimonas marina TaxID=299255 RepID=A0A1M5YD35_9GAMM|nr:HlyD family efflux transporter periplasmic adaptor subunit [Ferrimonas marina]SHI09937.1 RND family efflux transporter, MFP subunit [Ferrimonas marina]
MSSTPKKRWLPIGIALGVLCLVAAVMLRPKAPVNESYDRARLVEVMPLERAPLAPEISAFGRVEPKRVWQAVAELGGPVRYRNPQLEAGRLLPKGALLLEIEPLEFELRLAQARADRNAAAAQLTRLSQNENNLQASLELEQGRLQLTQAETERKQSLKQRSLISDSELDNQQQSLLAQRKLVQELENQLQLLPDDRQVAQAQLKVAEASVADAERRLSQTRVTMPFDGRVAEVSVETGQVVSANQVMVTLHGIDQMEIEVAVALHDMQRLLGSHSEDALRNRALSLQAEVQLDSGELSVNWDAEVVRIRESVDPNQATVGVVLLVKQDYQQLDLAQRPPLVKDLFVTARIRGPEREQVVVPSRALRGERLYLMDQQSRLRIEPVEVLYRRGDQVAVRGALPSDVDLVLNDLLPAVPGMLLRTEAEQ